MTNVLLFFRLKMDEFPKRNLESLCIFFRKFITKMSVYNSNTYMPTLLSPKNYPFMKTEASLRRIIHIFISSREKILKRLNIILFSAHNEASSFSWCEDENHSEPKCFPLISDEERSNTLFCDWLSLKNYGYLSWSI